VGDELRASDRLRRQHAELLRLADEIAPLLEVERLLKDHVEVRLKLSAWARRLKAHVALEERSVYPRLLQHQDPFVTTKAIRYQQKMQPLSDRITQYVERWTPTESAIQDDPTLFATETKTLFGLLSKRFQLEEKDLYLLVDRNVTASGTWSVDAEADVSAEDSAAEGGLASHASPTAKLAG